MASTWRNDDGSITSPLARSTYRYSGTDTVVLCEATHPASGRGSRRGIQALLRGGLATLR
jgi:hypothetical protein